MQPIENMLGKIQQLPSPPTVVMEIMNTFNNDQADIATLVGHINQDPALTVKVIRVANSSFFGLSRQIGSVQEAVMVIGFSSLRGLVTAAALVNAFPSGGGAFDGRHFWQHSIETGSCAKALARRLGADPEVAFTAGLLHDLGRLVLGVYFYDTFLRVLEYRKNNGVSMLTAEQAVLGLDHAALGAKAAERWYLPSAIQMAIGDHHLDEGRQTMLAEIVHIADQLCQARTAGGTPAGVPARFAETLSRLGLDAAALDSVAGEMERLNAGARLLL